MSKKITKRRAVIELAAVIIVVLGLMLMENPARWLDILLGLSIILIIILDIAWISGFIKNKPL